MARGDRKDRGTLLYVGGLASRSQTSDLERIFRPHGRVRDIVIRKEAFVEFTDPRDAENARSYLDGKIVDGHQIIVEFAKYETEMTMAEDGKNKSHHYGERDRKKKLTEHGRSYSLSPSSHRSRSPSLRRGRKHSSSPVRSRSRSLRYSRSRSRSVSRNYQVLERCSNCGVDGHRSRDCKCECYRCGGRGHTWRDCINGRDRSYSRSPDRSMSRSRSRSQDVSRSYRERDDAKRRKERR